MGSEGSCEVGGVGMEVVGMVADTAPSSSKGVRYFSGGGVTALVVEVLLGVGRFAEQRCGTLGSRLFTVMVGRIGMDNKKQQINQNTHIQ